MILATKESSEASVLRPEISAMLSDISSENEEKISAMSTEEIIAEQEQLTSMLGECRTSNINHVTSSDFCYVS